MKPVLTLTAASILALSSAVSAEQELTMGELDGVSAGGVAFAEAFADALGNVVSTSILTDTSVVSVAETFGQLGDIDTIVSNALAASSADADAQATALGQGVSTTVGTGLSDTDSSSNSVANSGVGSLPFAINMTQSSGVATQLFQGMSASSNSAGFSASALQN